MGTCSKIVVVGGGYAGALAAARASRKLGRHGEVHLISADDVLVERIRLHEAVANGRRVHHRLREVLDGSGVYVHRATVEHCDPDGRVVRADGAVIPFDRLILAVGSACRPALVEGADRHAHTLDPASVPVLREALAALPADGHVAICGGGLTGIEVAAELAETMPTANISLITSGVLGQMLSSRGRRHVVSTLTRLGVTVRDHTTVCRVSERLLETDRGAVPFDVCVWAGGFEPPSLARRSGLATDRAGRAVVDVALRASGHDVIYVIGDACAATSHDRTVPMGCKTALPMAAHAADNAVASLLGGSQRPFVFRDAAVCVSLGRRDGLLQVLAPDGRPLERVLVGKAAAWTKERICRFTLWRIGAEIRLLPWGPRGRASEAQRLARANGS